MTYTANELIVDSYYASGIVSREFETVNGTQLSYGLKWLNKILAQKRVDNGMISYETTYTFNGVVGQEKYFIPNLIQIDTLVFYLGNVRFPLAYTPRNQYFGTGRVENINTLPIQWYWERQIGGGNLYIYFEPDQNYRFEIHGTFNIAPVTQFQDLTSNVTYADLGIPTLYGTNTGDPATYATLSPGQLVVNNFDLMNTYPDIGGLVNYINTGVIPGVKASIVVNDFVLSSSTQPPTAIYIQTSGYLNGTNFIGNMAAATYTNLNATYANPDAGIGDTLTNAGTQAALVIDGYSVSLNDRILVINQTYTPANGSYSVTNVGSVSTNWVLTRTPNYNQPVQIGIGNLFFVQNGTHSANLTYIQTADVGYVGSSPILFSKFSAITFSNFSTIQNSNYQVFNAIGFDDFFIDYLHFALTDRICVEYNFDTPPGIKQQRREYEALIDKESRILDLQLTKGSTLQDRGTINWAWVNLGRGFFPPS